MPDTPACASCTGPYFAHWRTVPLCKDCWNIRTYELGLRDHERPRIDRRIREARLRVADRKQQEGPVTRPGQ